MPGIFGSASRGARSDKPPRRRPVRKRVKIASMTGGDVIGIIEAAYEVELDEFGWLRGILARAAPLLDHGLGAFAHSFDLASGMRVVMRAAVFSGIPDTDASIVAKTGNAMPPDHVDTLFGHTVTTISAALGAPASELDHHREAADARGAQDFLGVVARNPEGICVVIGAPLPKVTRLDPTFVHRWSRVGVHIAAAARMRQRLGDVITTIAPDLAVAAQRMQTARGVLRAEDPDRALAMWQPLVLERWSLVEGRDANGERVIVARENPVVATKHAVLDFREAQVAALVAIGHGHDLIAYELGLSVADVEAAHRSAQQRMIARDP